MRQIRSAAALFMLVAVAHMAPKTITLSVPGMTCATCPITITKALTMVKGVTRVDVSYEKLEAVVTYDDAKTTVEALMKATTDAGYPSTVKLPTKTEKGDR